MSSRNRNRPGVVKEEADEERQLWSRVRESGSRIDQLVVGADDTNIPEWRRNEHETHEDISPKDPRS